MTNFNNNWFAKYDKMTITSPDLYFLLKSTILSLDIGYEYQTKKMILSQNKTQNLKFFFTNDSLSQTIDFQTNLEHKEKKNSTNFSNNKLEKSLQELILGLLNLLQSFSLSELPLQNDSVPDFFELACNLFSLDYIYAQQFCGLGQRIPPHPLLHRILAILIRIEIFVDLLQKKISIDDTIDSYELLSKALSSRIEEFLLVNESLKDKYSLEIGFVKRLWINSKFFPYLDKNEIQDEKNLIYDNLKRKNLLNKILENNEKFDNTMNSINRVSFENSKQLYRLLLEESLIDQGKKIDISTDKNTKLLNKKRSNSAQKPKTKSEEINDEENTILTRSSKTLYTKPINTDLDNNKIPLINILQKPIIEILHSDPEKEEKNLFMENPLLLKSQFFTDKFRKYDSSYDFIPSGLRQLLDTRKKEFNNFPISISKSKNFLKSVNLPLNSIAAMTRQETCLEEKLIAKLFDSINGKTQEPQRYSLNETEIKNNRNSKGEISWLLKVKGEGRKNSNDNKKKTEKDMSLMTRLLNSYVREPGKNATVSQKLSYTLYTTLLSKDALFLKDSILISKGKKNGMSPNFSQVEIDERFEKRRKERVHKSSRESTTLILDNLIKEKEEFMKKSIPEIKKSTIVDMKIIPEEKEKRRKSNRGKGIKTTVVKEENLIKINKSTEIKEKLQSQHDLYEEKPLLAAFDEDIMEVTEEDTDMSNSSKHSLKASKNSLLFLSLKPEFVKTKNQKNIMTIFKKENSQNERRSIKNNEITQKILSDTSYQTANDFEVFQGKINKTKIHSKCLEN